jgi:hypothetical protein
VCVAVVFSWPLPLKLTEALLGPVGGDTGVYVWNLWVFRHELVEHGRLPFFTFEILALTSPVPLVLHNYTTFANVLALPLIPLAGVAGTFNVLSLASLVLTAFAMYLFARARSGDAVGGWLAGLVFGFSPFMSARMTEHFSLLLAAPIPIFAWLMLRIAKEPSFGLACAAGVTVAWAFLCDPYYAVYCLMTVAFMAVHSIIVVREKPAGVRRVWWRALLDLAIICVAGLVVGIVVQGGGSVELRGIRVSVRNLYTPVLVLTVLIVWRLALAIRRRIAWTIPPLWPYARLASVAATVCAILLSPVLYAVGSPFGESTWISPPVPWRSSAPGVDLLAYVIPNPYNPVIGGAGASLLRSLPNGFVENVASIPWAAAAAIVAIPVMLRCRLAGGMIAFTVFWMLLALGPFIRIAGEQTFVPTPWALLRYVPVVGAARMPTRMTVMVMFGVAVLLALAIRELRQRSSRGTRIAAAVGVLLVFELLPAPRVLHSAEVPAVYRVIREDPRPLRVMTLPFGLRDGLSSRGNRRNRVMRTLMRLSEGRPVEPELMDYALAHGPDALDDVQLGWVVVDTWRAAPELRDFAIRAFRLTPVMSEGGYELYSTPLTRSAEEGAAR